MSIFHYELKKRFNNQCILSKITTFEAIHIIPRFICQHLEYNDLILNSYNGLLMTNTLHAEFDRYYWSFDIYNITYIDDKWITLPIVINPNYRRKLLIHSYKNDRIKVPCESIAFLWVHYQIFLTYNFSKMTQNITELYRDILNSRQFDIIYNNPQMINTISDNFVPSHIISARKFKQEFLVIDRYRPIGEMRWLSIDEIDNNLIENYLEYSESLDDPDWKEPPNIKRKIGENAYIYEHRFSVRIANQQK